MTDHLSVHTVDTLAEVWSCSAHHIRHVINRDELLFVRTRRLLRLRAAGGESIETEVSFASEGID